MMKFLFEDDCCLFVVVEFYCYIDIDKDIDIDNYDILNRCR